MRKTLFRNLKQAKAIELLEWLQQSDKNHTYKMRLMLGVSGGHVYQIDQYPLTIGGRKKLDLEDNKGKE